MACDLKKPHADLNGFPFVLGVALATQVLETIKNPVSVLRNLLCILRWPVANRTNVQGDLTSKTTPSTLNPKP